MTTPTTRTLGRDDWTTPPEVFEPVNELVRFDLDACATDASVARLPQFISPEEDSLTVKWSERGSRVWCNPPYGRGIKHWFAKAATEARDLEQLVLLVYANTDTAYWHEHVAGCLEAQAVVFIKPRVKFILPGMDTRAGAPKGSALVFYSRRAASTLKPLQHFYWDYKIESLSDVVS